MALAVQKMSVQEILIVQVRGLISSVKVLVLNPKNVSKRIPVLLLVVITWIVANVLVATTPALMANALQNLNVLPLVKTTSSVMVAKIVKITALAVLAP